MGRLRRRLFGISPDEASFVRRGFEGGDDLVAVLDRAIDGETVTFPRVEAGVLDDLIRDVSWGVGLRPEVTWHMAGLRGPGVRFTMAMTTPNTRNVDVFSTTVPDLPFQVVPEIPSAVILHDCRLRPL